MKNPERYIGGTTGGVPESIFRPGFNSKIPGISGEAALKCTVTNDYVAIEDAANEELHFRMRYWPQEEAAALSVRTKPGNADRHPDLYAAQLVGRGLAYLEEQGLPVKQIRGAWRPPRNDNYTQYYANLKELMTTKSPRDITSEDRRKAASQTWTGDLAKSLGYDQINSFEITDTGTIVVLFGNNQK